MSDRGPLCLILHSHMPYVEGYGTWPFGEEWLWEAVAGVYLPLLEVLERSEAQVTVGLTPVLCDQLETLSGDSGDRLASYLRTTKAQIHAEDAAGLDSGGHRELAAEVRRAAGDYTRAEEALAGGADPLASFGRLAAGGAVELWTSAATHAVLPLLATEAGLRLQAVTGIASHEARFGASGGGFWLPECAYEPGLAGRLAPHGIRVTCVDQTEVHGLGAPEHLEPVLAAPGLAALPLDWLTVARIWDPRGYPADPRYRDYHRRTIHDLRPWNNGGDTYSHEEGSALARRHAREFVAAAIERLDGYTAERGRPGVLTCALDTELLGHWWYEGLTWLDAVVAEARSQGLELATASAALERAELVEREPAASTWGVPKDLSTWDSPRVAEVAFRARGAELATVAAAARPHEHRDALVRAARELLALQASDWAFQLTRDLAADYPLERLAGHGAAHDAALAALADSAAVPDPAVRNLAPHLELAPLVAP